MVALRPATPPSWLMLITAEPAVVTEVVPATLIWSEVPVLLPRSKLRVFAPAAPVIPRVLPSVRVPTAPSVRLTPPVPLTVTAPPRLPLPPRAPAVTETAPFTALELPLKSSVPALTVVVPV